MKKISKYAILVLIFSLETSLLACSDTENQTTISAQQPTRTDSVSEVSPAEETSTTNSSAEVSYTTDSSEELSPTTDSSEELSPTTNSSEEVSPATTSASGNKLTLDDIKKNYTEAKILNITNINTDFVLVESKRDTFASEFDLYNLKTGDKEVLPTTTEYVTLKKVVNENYIVFEDSGKNSESPFSSFPRILNCIRTSNGTNRSDNFTSIYENEYYDLNRSVSSGSKEGNVLSVINVTFDGFEVMFKPKSVDDTGFYADVTDIPPTTTAYDSSTSKFTLEIATSLLGETLKPNVDIKTDDNLYISSYRIEQKNNKTYIIASLRSTAKKDIMKNNGGEYFPYFLVDFEE